MHRHRAHVATGRAAAATQAGCLVVAGGFRRWMAEAATPDHTLPRGSALGRRIDFGGIAARAVNTADELGRQRPVGSQDAVEAELDLDRAEQERKLIPGQAQLAEQVRRQQTQQDASAAKKLDGRRSVWFDDQAADRDAARKHIRSPEYVELHRGTLSNADMGLFGGEAGFEKSPRVHVDPDRPHIRYMFTQEAYASNIRHSSYGYYKRELQLTDYDKLIRHARKLPTPEKMLHDAVNMRVALTDKNAAAIIKHGRRSMVGMDLAQRRAAFVGLERTFERMLITSIPPISVGARTHAEMIRACTTCLRFDEGFNWFYKRAIEEAADWTRSQASRRSAAAAMTAAPEAHGSVQSPPDDAELTSSSGFDFVSTAEPFELDADLYDAVIELCVTTGHDAQALVELERAVASGRRLLTRTLESALFACAQLRIASEAESVWQLFAFYSRDPSPRAFEAWAACAARCAAAGDTDSTVARSLHTVIPDAMRALKNSPAVADSSSQASQLPTVVSETTYAWVLHGLAMSPQLGNGRHEEVLALVESLSDRLGDAGAPVLTMALQYCVQHTRHGAATAAGIWARFVVGRDVTPTTEMVLLLARAIAYGDDAPRPEHARLVADALAVLQDRNGGRDARFVRFSQSDDNPDDPLPQQRGESGPTSSEGAISTAGTMRRREREVVLAITTARLVICARLGAAAEALSIVARTTLDAQDGFPTPTFFFSYALTANANAAAPLGSHHITQELLGIATSLETFEITQDIVGALCACRRAHGKIPEPSQLFDALADYGIPEKDVSLLELMDAWDLKQKSTATDGPGPTTGDDSGLLALATDAETTAELRRHTDDVINALPSDMDSEVFSLAVQPFTIDPYSMRKRSTNLFFEANTIHLHKVGQYAPLPRDPSHKGQTLTQQSWRRQPFGHFPGQYVEM